MSLDFGNGVSRTLTAIKRQFSSVVWQAGKPPLDSEANLGNQIAWENLRQLVRAMMPSGFILDPTRSLEDFQFDPQWANLFKFGNPRVPQGELETPEEDPVIWANVNGWILPVVGTQVTEEGDLSNWIKLYPPPETDRRIDFLFLEAWQCRVDPNPSEVNKPNASTLWKYGNVLYGGTNLTDDLEDPSIGMETTGRIQVQYRLRVFGGAAAGVGGSVALEVHPDGLGDPNILGQGTADDPIPGFSFDNMREDLGDPGLWRAGDGDAGNALGTIDGYTYAIPIAAIFRRNSKVYQAVTDAGDPEQNGGFERTPNSKHLPIPLDGAQPLPVATLAEDLSPTAAAGVSDATISVSNLEGSGWDDPQHTLSNIFILIDGEIMGISAVDDVAGTVTIPAGGRGRWGTAAVGHSAGASLQFFNTRPDGLYSDEIAQQDVLDLRHGVNANDWDFKRLLEHNVAALAKNELRSAWKDAAAGDTQGVTVNEVDYLWAGRPGPLDPPNHTEALDGPDGIRYIWSDGAVIQPEVTLLLDNEASQDDNKVGFNVTDTFDTNTNWDVGADFKPSGFMNVANLADTDGWVNGTSLFFFLGGDDGTHGARGTFRDGSTRAVRAVMPREYWKSGYPDVDPENGNQYPISLRLIDFRAFEPAPEAILPEEAARHAGPMYPWRATNFEYPFIALGGLLRNELTKNRSASDLEELSGDIYEIDVGIDFDDGEGIWWSQDDHTGPGTVDIPNFQNDPTAISKPLLRGTRTLYGMLTNNGKNSTGSQSEIYVVLYGDTDSRNNNGAFRVIGAGTASLGLTSSPASAATRIRVEPMSQDFTTFDTATGNNITVEFRSQEHNSDDTSDYDSNTADLVIVFTDICGKMLSSGTFYGINAWNPIYNYPWERYRLGFGESYDLSLPCGGVEFTYPLQSKLEISFTLMYHPGRGGSARVPDEIVRFAMVGGLGETLGAYLRQSPASLDLTFPNMPTNETYWDPAHIQLWNKLPALGWYAPNMPSAGGQVVGFTEQDREHELFIDRGSKTIMFRPFRDREMTLKQLSFEDAYFAEIPDCLLGSYQYPNGCYKDALNLFTQGGSIGGNGKQSAYAMPREWMPRFGRQDIPYYTDTSNGQGPFLPGINHLFVDTTDTDAHVFHIIGGSDNNGSPSPGVYSMYFTTDTPSNYGGSGTFVAAWNNLPYYKARKTTDIDDTVLYADEVIEALNAVNSSDLGRGLKGIQLPPYLGIARLYGVYDKRDWDTFGGRTFQGNRWEMLSDSAPNLIREDADQQTLFILQDGAKDLCSDSMTESEGDHTYIVPSNILDLTRSTHYTDGETFEDLDYVVECCIFGFAKGWIDQNNYVLVRWHDGSGDPHDDSDEEELEGIHLCIPCPAGYNDQLYNDFNRTVYQGDPYMTRGGEVTVASDYEHRYGQVPISGQYAMETPIQQYFDGEYIPQTPNARGFEVLASMDFYTTLGTGKIGGELFPGTPLDVGFTCNKPPAALRQPSSDDQPAWRIKTRAFTEGQKTNDSRAELTLFVQGGVDTLNPDDENYVFCRFGLLDGTYVDLYGAQAAYKSKLTDAPPAGLGIPEEDVWDIDTTSIQSFIKDSTQLVGTYAPGFYTFTNKAISGVTVGDTVIINAREDLEHIVFEGHVPTDGIVRVGVFNTWTPTAYDWPQGVPGYTIVPVSIPVAAIPANTGVPFPAQTLSGVLPGDVVVLSQDHTVPPPPGYEALIVTAAVVAPDTVDYWIYNASAAPVGPGPIMPFLAAILQPQDVAAHTVDLDGKYLDITVIHDTGDLNETVTNLASAINRHSTLSQNCLAIPEKPDKVRIAAVPTGAEGNEVTYETKWYTESVPPTVNSPFQTIIPFADTTNEFPFSLRSSSPLSGGVDRPMNAGDGTSQVNITGMTERLPLGALLQDSDFLCENPLRDDASAMKASPTGPRPIQTLMPLVERDEYDRFFGEPGALFAQSDGSVSVTDYSAWTEQNTGGSRIFRLFRGGGSVYVLDGQHPGGPVDWVTETFSDSLQPVMKGGALVCRALLVRNFYEEADLIGGSYTLTDGDEIQMVIVTYGVLGTDTTQEDGVTLGGDISPAGYGEGFAAADRYRLGARPMFRGFNREIPNPANVVLAPYPEEGPDDPGGGPC